MIANLFTVAVACASVAVAASLHDNNLAYLSPSRRHPSLAVPVASMMKRQESQPLYTAKDLNFTHGVASGDPLADSVIIWTRLSPTSHNMASDTMPEGVVPIYGHPEAEAPTDRIACVEFKIATDKEMQDVVDDGSAYTSSDVDYTVKVRICSAGRLSVALYNEPNSYPTVRSHWAQAFHHLLLPVQCLRL